MSLDGSSGRYSAGGEGSPWLPLLFTGWKVPLRMTRNEGSCCLCGLACPSVTLPPFSTFSLSTPPEGSKPVTHVTRESSVFPANLRYRAEVMVGGRGSGSPQKFMAGDIFYSFCGMFCLWYLLEKGTVPEKEGSIILGKTLPRAQLSFPGQQPTGKGKRHRITPLPFLPSHKDFCHLCVH